MTPSILRRRRRALALSIALPTALALSIALPTALAPAVPGRRAATGAEA